MIQGLHSAAMGVNAQMRRIDTIADNLANVSTTGFKSTRVDFKDAIYSQIKLQEESQIGNNLEMGHGTLVSATKRYFTQGSFQNTGNLTDFAIQGDAFFTVGDLNGNVRYTRNGSFMVSTEADGEYLVVSSGEYVLDTNGNRIRLDGKLEHLSVNADGDISIDGNNMGRLGMVTFTNNAGLLGDGQSSFIPSESSGQPMAAQPGSYAIQQGMVEMSNVDTAEEMTRLIRTQRALQLSSRGITTADEMESIANNMRR